jgi:Predicted nucleotide-binding protein containing TIR-like domain
MALPIKTTAADVRNAVKYFGTKPTGANIKDAKAAAGAALVDGRKLSAYQRWGILARDGEKYKLTPLGWELHRKPQDEQAVFTQIIDSMKPYRGAIEWMYHQNFDSVSVIDVAAHWHEHHLDDVGENAKDGTIRENAVAFFHLCDAAGLGTLKLGRGGQQPTRLEINKSAVKALVEAGPSAPPWPGAQAQPDEAAAEPEEEPEAETPTIEPESETPAPPAQLRAFISHGKNTEIVSQVETMLDLADIKSEIAESEETTAIPVPDKVFDAMRRCQAGIIICSVEESSKDADGNFALNDNVLIEIGAAFVLYEKRVVLVWDKRLAVPSNLQGLYRCEFEGDDLSWGAGMKLMKAIRGFKT